ncbi:hypothetical protein FRB97_003284 [Tulasnella sp. 331]|nr:hypothetical protein FRB97_003284 [Tulasnella sp. 331]
MNESLRNTANDIVRQYREGAILGPTQFKILHKIAHARVGNDAERGVRDQAAAIVKQIMSDHVAVIRAKGTETANVLGPRNPLLSRQPIVNLEMAKTRLRAYKKVIGRGKGKKVALAAGVIALSGVAGTAGVAAGVEIANGQVNDGGDQGNDGSEDGNDQDDGASVDSVDDDDTTGSTSTSPGSELAKRSLESLD